MTLNHIANHFEKKNMRNGEKDAMNCLTKVFSIVDYFRNNMYFVKFISCFPVSLN